MRSRAIAALLALAAALGAAACGDGSEEGATGSGFDAQRAFALLRDQVEFGPRPAGSAAARRTAAYIARRLREAGVREVRIQRPHANVVGRLPGMASGSVVVGAHYDTKDVPPIVGANDGASGVAVVLELAAAMPRRLDGPSLDFALFDAEEARGERGFEHDGVRGSSQYVEYARDGGAQGSPPLEEIRAMVLFDLVGDCDLEIPREASSEAGLYELFAQAAEDVDGDAAPFEGESGPVLDDHTPFLGAGVRALDLIDFRYGPGPSPGAYWHTREDTIDKVCADSLDAVGEAALDAIPRIR